MQVICISRGTYSGGREFAVKLAEKLGYACLGREELIEAATEEGIQVGKLEMTMTRSSVFSERLALERDHYLAFSTAYLCEKAMKNGGLVYHGRTGHLLLPGVSHVLRARVLADEEYRTRAVMRNLGLERDKARRYIEGVDEDRRRWVRSMYGVSWEDAANYDVVINLAQMSMENAASALTNMAQLPDFQMTPASRKAMEDLLLASRARMAIARDERTHRADVKARADNGVVTVTYLPQDAKVAEHIPEVCKDLPGMEEVRTTMAMTNLLWIQEEFQPHTELYNQVVEIATKWNAAVELLRLAPEEEATPGEDGQLIEPGREPASQEAERFNGGIEEEVGEDSAGNDGLKQTLDELAKEGKSGGGRVVYGGQKKLANSIDKTVPYTLVVIGEVFLDKGHSAKLRATRDLRSFLSDRIKAPVVTSDELGSQYLFGKRDIPRVIAFLLVALIIYFLVFTHEEIILNFLANTGWYAEWAKGTFLANTEWAPKVIVSIAVFILVPIVAYLYGSVTSAFLKLIKME
ncbi:MAG: cytidylate kinase-like family protein [bacterium]